MSLYTLTPVLLQPKEGQMAALERIRLMSNEELEDFSLSDLNWDELATMHMPEMGLTSMED